MPQPREHTAMLKNDPELCLLAHMFDDFYQTAQLPFPSNVDWERFSNMVRINKLALLAYSKVLANSYEVPAHWRASFEELKEYQVAEREKLSLSLKQAKLFLGESPYVLVKTYRPFPYFTHDIDILVRSTDEIGKKVTAAGVAWDDIPRGSVQVEQPQWLDIEFYERVLPGSIQVIDDELTLLNPVSMTLQGEAICVASPEIEIVTLLADTVFRLYELKLGDMIYIFTLAASANWEVLIQQSIKHQWYQPFQDLVAVLNGYHRELYGSASPMEDYIPKVNSVSKTVPYVPSWIATIQALSGQGNRHLLKLPSYISVLLKQNHPKIHSFYIRFFQVPVGRFVLRHIYR